MSRVKTWCDMCPRADDWTLACFRALGWGSTLIDSAVRSTPSRQ